MRTAVYMRISTKEQNFSLQEQEISLFLQNKGITDYEIYRDRGYKGDTIARPQLKRLLEALKTGSIEYLVVWKLDRVFRSLKHLIGFIETLKQTNTKFAAVKDNIDLTTPQGELLVNVIASFAQFEKSLISERTRSGMHAAKINNPDIRYGRKPKITNDLNIKVMELYKQRHTYEQIQAILNIKYNTVQRIITRAKILDAQNQANAHKLGTENA